MPGFLLCISLPELFRICPSLNFQSGVLRLQQVSESHGGGGGSWAEVGETREKCRWLGPTSRVSDSQEVRDGVRECECLIRPQEMLMLLMRGPHLGHHCSYRTQTGLDPASLHCRCLTFFPCHYGDGHGFFLCLLPSLLVTSFYTHSLLFPGPLFLLQPACYEDPKDKDYANEVFISSLSTVRDTH